MLCELGVRSGRITRKYLRNNGRNLHSKKNREITLCQESSRTKNTGKRKIRCI